MKDRNKSKTKEDPIKGYDHTDRDFQQTENDIDNVSKSEKDALNQRTKRANTKPGKHKIW